ncbi:Nitrate excretion transporter 1 [Morus notabilis]|uniref:Nitrate excretion transporter 1 n=1 Tax=Morus notabilis TaxID=981085 RepID=W9SAJ9_9ROSA|nr:Nitrate excretion transporter 1 [Morus notabilis]
MCCDELLNTFELILREKISLVSVGHRQVEWCSLIKLPKEILGNGDIVKERVVECVRPFVSGRNRQVDWCSPIKFLKEILGNGNIVKEGVVECGMILFALTAMLDSLRPAPCKNGLPSLCKSPSRTHYAVLYSGLALLSSGTGCTRFTLATVGANQFEKQDGRDIFFNWYFFIMYMSAVIASTAIVYVEDNISWELGFGICILVSLIGVAIFLSGKRFYLRDKPLGSPFLDFARVVVACFRKRKVLISSRSEDYYYGHDGNAKIVATIPAKNFRVLNRAALKTEGDLKPDGSVAKPWRLCTVQQVEDVKALIRILPLWSSSIFLSTPIAVQRSLTVLQALTMDRHLGSNFKIPAVNPPTPFQRIGVGHAMNVLSMAISALVKSKRLKVAHNYGSNLAPTLALWLFPQLVFVGVGEAFHFPGQVGFYYQEFPASLKSTATAMVSIVIAIAYYLSSALIDLVRRITGWLSDDINKGRLDSVYWALVVLGVLNFGYFLVC